MMLLSEHEIQLPNGFTMRIGKDMFHPGTDTLALAEFAHLRGCSHLIDLGCGCGAFPLLLAPKYTGLHITGIEIDPIAAQYAVENIEAAQLSDCVCIQCADLRSFSSCAGIADSVISNPPYFEEGRGALASPSKAFARADQLCSCHELVAVAARLLKTGGRFFLLWRPERLVELFYELRSAGLEPKRLRIARGKRARFVMLEALRGGNPGLLIEPDLDLQRR